MPADAKTNVMSIARLTLINHFRSVHLPPRDFRILSDESVPEEVDEVGEKRPWLSELGKYCNW